MIQKEVILEVMIYDCFSFFNELDVLEIRLNTLKNVVDKFVLAEAVWTHTGKPKPLYFEENKKRFEPFLDKIIHIVVTEKDLPSFPAGSTEREIAWIRENVQRNAIAKGLVGASPDDVILIADLDEIPNPDKVLDAARSPDGITNINLKNYSFFLNNLNVADPVWAGGPQLLTYRTFLDKGTYAQFSYSEYAPRCANPVPSATVVRFVRKNRNVRNSGWHLTSMGGPKAIRAKLQAFAHTEFSSNQLSDEDMLERLRGGAGLFYFGEAFMAEPPEIALPDYVRENAERFSAMILPSDLKHWRRDRLKRLGFRLRKFLHDWFIGVMIALVPQSLHPLFARIRRYL